MSVQPIPEGHHTVTPYLVVDGADQLIRFVEQSFGAEELVRMDNPDGSVMHAMVRIGDSNVMLGDASGEYKAQPAMLHLYVENADTVYERALQAGASSLKTPTDEFYGDRMGAVLDPLGNQWWIATHIEDLSPEEPQKRSEAAMAQ